MTSSIRLGSLIDRLARLHAAARRRPGLNDVQVSALDYLDQANAVSRSPSAVADYLDATRGTVSQTLRALARKGLIVAASDPADRRSLRYDLTAKGREVLRAEGAGFPDEDGALEQALGALVGRMIAARGGRSFGICRTCRFHQVLEDGSRRCTLLDQALAPPETGRICREHAA